MPRLFLRLEPASSRLVLDMDGAYPHAPPRAAHRGRRRVKVVLRAAARGAHEGAAMRAVHAHALHALAAPPRTVSAQAGETGAITAAPPRTNESLVWRSFENGTEWLAFRGSILVFRERAVLVLGESAGAATLGLRPLESPVRHSASPREFVAARAAGARPLRRSYPLGAIVVVTSRADVPALQWLSAGAAAARVAPYVAPEPRGDAAIGTLAATLAGIPHATLTVAPPRVTAAFLAAAMTEWW